MRSIDFFVEEQDPNWDINGDPWTTITRLDEGLLKAVRRAPLDSTSDVSVAAGLLDLVQEELESYGTSGGQQLDDRQIGLAIRALTSVTRRLGVPLELPFRDFTRFRDYWKRNGGHGSWQARRDMLEQWFEPARQALTRIEEQYDAGRPQLSEELIANLQDPAAIQELLGRVQRAIVDDPALTIGCAKELIESTAKAVLIERGKSVNESDDVPALVFQAQQALNVHPSSPLPGPDGTDAVKKILGGAVTVTAGLAELRNRYGTGHGASGKRVGLTTRHAHLARDASITWCRFMLDTLSDPKAPWRRSMAGSDDRDG